MAADPPPCRLPARRKRSAPGYCAQAEPDAAATSRAGPCTPVAALAEPLIAFTEDPAGCSVRVGVRVSEIDERGAVVRARGRDWEESPDGDITTLRSVGNPGGRPAGWPTGISRGERVGAYGACAWQREGYVPSDAVHQKRLLPYIGSRASQIGYPALRTWSRPNALLWPPRENTRRHRRAARVGARPGAPPSHLSRRRA